jgi:hypothetical protein
MLNFGEHGYCHILHNFGIQRVTRFQLLSAQKVSITKLCFDVWTAAIIVSKIATH